MFGTGNPALNESTFDNDFGRFGSAPAVQDRGDVMTVSGTVWKSLLLLAIIVAVGSFTWGQTMMNGAPPMPWMIGGMIGGFVLALGCIFKPNWSPFLAPLYAAAQGLFLGGISAVYEIRFGAGAGNLALSGIAVQAAGLTMGTAASMFILYAFRIIKVTEKLRAGILMAVGAVALFYLVSIVLSFFGIQIPMVHGSGPIGIGVSVVIIAIAAFSLLLDFDLIERGARSGAEKHMEWYGAFALMVTLVWLYLEMLRLLAKLQSRD